MVLDGYVDKAEFEAGILKLGLSFGPDSLALSSEQQQELLDHIFSEPDTVARGLSQVWSCFLLQHVLCIPCIITDYMLAELCL